jgi:hypothetical protein
MLPAFTPPPFNPANPRQPYILNDDFLFASTETGEVGDLGWSFTNGTWNLVAAELGHPGICRRATTAVANTVASAFPGGGGTAVNLRFDQWREMVWIVKPVTTSTDVIIRLGVLNDMTANPPTNGAYIEKLAADTNWFGVARQSASEVRVDLGVAATADVWASFRMRQINATSVGFSVNGGAEIVASGATVPAATTNMVQGFQATPTTANARNLDIDFFSIILAAQDR